VKFTAGHEWNMAMRDAEQQKSAVEVMRKYLDAAPNTEGKAPKQVQTERDQKRREVIDQTLRPLLGDFLGGRIQLPSL
jgi:hypothetical protein